MIKIKGRTGLSKPQAVVPTAVGPGGAPGPGNAPAMASPKAPGGQGFLINHNAFTDARPPGARGARKSQGYPNYPIK